MKKAIDVANYFLSMQDEDAGDAISNLKLQKLVYYAQGFSLALYHKPLFEEEIKAWEHGPVISELYRKFKDYKAGPIPMPKNFDPNSFNRKEKELLDDINEVYGQYSAWKLRNMTHNDKPWKEAYESPHKSISTESLRNYFSNFLVDCDEKKENK